jgi:hypothetical protein
MQVFGPVKHDIYVASRANQMRRTTRGREKNFSMRDNTYFMADILGPAIRTLSSLGMRRGYSHVFGCGHEIESSRSVILVAKNLPGNT